MIISILCSVFNRPASEHNIFSGSLNRFKSVVKPYVLHIRFISRFYLVIPVGRSGIDNIFMRLADIVSMFGIKLRYLCKSVYLLPVCISQSGCKRAFLRCRRISSIRFRIIIRSVSQPNLRNISVAILHCLSKVELELIIHTVEIYINSSCTVSLNLDIISIMGALVFSLKLKSGKRTVEFIIFLFISRKLLALSGTHQGEVELFTVDVQRVSVAVITKLPVYFRLLLKVKAEEIF